MGTLLPVFPSTTSPPPFPVFEPPTPTHQPSHLPLFPFFLYLARALEQKKKSFTNTFRFFIKLIPLCSYARHGSPVCETWAENILSCVGKCTVPNGCADVWNTDDCRRRSCTKS